MVFEWFKGDPYIKFNKAVERLRKYEKRFLRDLKEEEVKEIKEDVKEVISGFRELKNRFYANKELYRRTYLINIYKFTKNIFEELEAGIDLLDKSIDKLENIYNKLEQYWNGLNFEEATYHKLFDELTEIVSNELVLINEIKENSDLLANEGKEKEKKYFPDILGSSVFRKQLKDKSLLTDEIVNKLNERLEKMADPVWLEKHTEKYHVSKLRGLIERGHVLRIIFYLDGNTVKVCEMFTDHNKYIRRVETKNLVSKYHDFKRIEYPIIIPV